MKALPSSAAVLALALITACAPSDPKHPKFIVAQVGSTKITRAQLNDEFTRMTKRIGMDAALLNEDQASSLEWYALNEMVNRIVVRQALSPEQAAEVTRQADQRLAAIKGQFGDEASYQKALESEGLSEQEIREDLTFRVAIQTLLPKDVPRPSMDDAKNFYDSNPELWKSPEQVRARHVLIRTEPNASIEQVNASKKAADAARARVAQGEDFGKVASEVSEDPGSKALGGELPAFGRGQMVPEFEKAAFETAPGKVSPVFKTEFGYHFLQVLEKKAARTVPFEEVASRIVQAVGQQQEAESARNLVAELRRKAQVAIHIPEPGSAQLVKEQPTQP